MIGGPRTARAALALLCLVLAACTSAPKRKVEGSALDPRAAALATSPRWSLDGRVAVSDGQDAGSGRITWQQDGEDYVIEVRAPDSRHTCRLTRARGELVLEGARAHPVRGADAEDLLAREVGWRLPIAEMRHWVRGLASRPDARVALREDGLPATIEEAGWRVDYTRYDGAGDPPLPRRIEATRAPYRVRLAIAAWHPQ